MTVEEVEPAEAGEEVLPHVHTFEHVVEMISGEPTALLCPGCKRSWPVGVPPAAAPTEEETAGYVVVNVAGDDPQTAQWMSPARYESVVHAGAERKFWSSGRHLQRAQLRLAKLVLLAEEDPGGF
ncbi:hypothetical protein ACIHFD_49270 [Nonomuraea sp. NPDC051941]|uniref:hypothetical protein n=1 Tax=Nonomuraea sp. NPDC051941 TaxID=3364373 RepID=UPI0037C52994